MSEQLWSAVDSYICDLLAPADPALDAALEASVRAGLPAIQVAPNQGKLLHLLARLIGARAHSRNRNARRLQHDLARPRAAA